MLASTHLILVHTRISAPFHPLASMFARAAQLPSFSGRSSLYPPMTPASLAGEEPDLLSSLPSNLSSACSCSLSTLPSWQYLICRSLPSQRYSTTASSLSLVVDFLFLPIPILWPSKSMITGVQVSFLLE